MTLSTGKRPLCTNPITIRKQNSLENLHWAVSDITGSMTWARVTMWLAVNAWPCGSVTVEQSAKGSRNGGHTRCHRHEARTCEFIDPVAKAPRHDIFLLRKRSDHGLHTSGIEVLKLMRELRDMNKSLNTGTGVIQCGFDQPALETADPRRRTKEVGRSSACRLTNGAVRDRHPCGCSRSQPDTERRGDNHRVLVAGSLGHGILHATFAPLTTGSANTTGELEVWSTC